MSQYEDGKISDDDYSAPCEWSVKGSTVKIIENADEDAEIEESEDQVFWLKDVKITRTQIRCSFSLQGNYTAGIEKLVYDIEE